jgi:hypothetical protein
MPERIEAIHRIPALSLSVIVANRVSCKVELTLADDDMVEKLTRSGARYGGMRWRPRALSFQKRGDCLRTLGRGRT